MFKAKPLVEINENELEEWGIPVTNGYVTGYLIQDGTTYFITGLHEVTDEYTSAEWWCPVEELTIRLTKEGEAFLNDNRSNG